MLKSRRAETFRICKEEEEEKRDVESLGVFTVEFQQQCLGQPLSQSNQFCSALGEMQIRWNANWQEMWVNCLRGRNSPGKITGSGDGFASLSRPSFTWEGRETAAAHLSAPTLITLIKHSVATSRASHFQGNFGLSMARAEKFTPWMWAEVATAQQRQPLVWSCSAGSSPLG